MFLKILFSHLKFCIVFCNRYINTSCQTHYINYCTTKSILVPVPPPFQLSFSFSCFLVKKNVKTKGGIHGRHITGNTQFCWKFCTLNTRRVQRSQIYLSFLSYSVKSNSPLVMTTFCHLFRMFNLLHCLLC
jgi:hypothetical protein